MTTSEDRIASLKAQWLANPTATIEAFFALGGPLAKAVGPRYKLSDVQLDFARTAAVQTVKGFREPGVVTMLEAETGIGKTIACLAAGMINGVLNGARTIYSTYTNELKTQAALRDGPGVAQAVETFTGVRPSIAIHLASPEFASPTRARLLADEIEREGGDAESVEALRDLADWTENELADTEASSDQVAIVTTMRATVPLWASLKPWLAEGLPKDAYDLWCVDASCGEDEQIVRKLHLARSKTADIVVCSHASLITDLMSYGARLGGAERPFGLAIIDEADKMSDAARSILAEHTTFLSLERAARTAMATVAACESEIGEASMRVATGGILEEMEVLDKLSEASHKLSENYRMNRPRFSRVPVTGDDKMEPWLVLCEAAHPAVARIAGLLKALPSDSCKELARTLGERSAQMERFCLAARDEKKSSGRTYIDFSPVREEPSVLIDAKHGSRITQRLWNGGKDGDRHLAFSTIVTSATLAQPGARGSSRFDQIAHELGLDFETKPGRRQARDTAAERTLSPKIFGELQFVLAHPDAPVPVRVADEGNAVDAIEHHPAYVARMIVEASRRPNEHGRANILCLTTSFAYAKAIADCLPDDLTTQVLARTRDVSMNKAAAWFKATPNAILIAPGAWEGLDLPRMVDHLVVSRLPYAPPEDAYGVPIAIARDDGTSYVSTETARMMRRLRQGIGRAIRQWDDKATIWIADPRFGFPSAVGDRGMFLIPQYPSGAVFHACVPVRFRAAFNAAEIFPVGEAPSRRLAAKAAEANV